MDANLLSPFLSAGDGCLTKTAAAGTRIQFAVGGTSGHYFTNLAQFSYTAGVFDHEITVMRGASRDVAQFPVATGGILVTTAAKLTDGDGNDIAAGDVVAVQLADGDWHVSTVALLDSPKTGITLTTAIPTGRSVPLLAKVVNYGLPGDAMHASHQVLCSANQATVRGIVSLTRASSRSEPIVLDSNNVGAAGRFDFACAAYSIA